MKIIANIVLFGIYLGIVFPPQLKEFIMNEPDLPFIIGLIVVGVIVAFCSPFIIQRQWPTTYVFWLILSVVNIAVIILMAISPFWDFSNRTYTVLTVGVVFCCTIVLVMERQNILRHHSRC